MTVRSVQTLRVKLEKSADTPLSAKNVVSLLFMAASTVLAGIQLTMGSYFTITFLIWAIAVISAAFPLRRNIRVSDILIFLFGLYAGTLTLFFKTLLGQKLQTNLMFPNEAASYLFIWFCAVAICAVLASKIVGHKSSKISRRMNDLANRSSHLVIPLALFGIITRFGFIYFAKGQLDKEAISPIAAYFNLFFPVYIFAVFMAAFHTAKGHKGAKFALIACIVASFGMAVIGNVKVEVVNIFLVLFFAVLFLGLRVKIRHLIVGGFVMFFSLSILAPAIQIMRVSLSDIPASQRFGELWKIIENANFNPETLAVLQGALFTGYQFSYAEYSSYVYPSTANVDRFMLVFPVDQVTRSLDQASNVDLSDLISETAEMILPSFIVSKDREAFVDLVAWDRGIRANGSVARPVLGFAATSLALGGWIAVAIIPFVSVLPFLIVCNYYFGRVGGYVFGAFGCFNMALFPEKEIDRYFGYMLRELPLQWVTFMLVLFAVSVLSGRLVLFRRPRPPSI